MKITNLLSLVRDTGSAWLRDRAPRLGAALAYYTIFSLAPLLVIVIAIAGLVFGQEAARGQIVGQIQDLVGIEGAEAIQAMLESAGRPGAGLTGSVLGIIMLVFGAVGLFGQLQDALDTIWGVDTKSGRGIWSLVRGQFRSISMVLGLAFLLLVSLIVSAALTALMQNLGNVQACVIGYVANELVSLAVLTALFAMIFKYLPDALIGWRDVWLGAVVTAVLFELGKFLIGLYLGHSSIASGYGAAGSLAVLLVWIYYSSQVFLFGAEFTRVYANRFGSGIQPIADAVATESQSTRVPPLVLQERGP